MKRKQLKIKVLIAAQLLIGGGLMAQTWSQGSNEIRTGIPSGGYSGTATPTNGSLLFYNSTNTNTVSFQTGTTSTSYTMILPTAQGTTNTVLTNDGSGNLSWAAGTSVYEKSETVSSSQISNLGTTPITIVLAPGIGKYIEVISASATIASGSTPYSGNTDLELRCVGAEPQVTELYLLLSTVARNLMFHEYSTNMGTTQTQLLANTALELGVPSGGGNPSGGNLEIKIKVLYRIVTI